MVVTGAVHTPAPMRQPPEQSAQPAIDASRSSSTWSVLWSVVNDPLQVKRTWPPAITSSQAFAAASTVAHASWLLRASLPYGAIKKSATHSAGFSLNTVE